jgi:hypothetical protein
MKHKIPTSGKPKRILNCSSRVCRSCNNLTLHYQLARIGWVCSRVVNALRARGVEVEY